jgi:hypothetical protein
MIDTLGIRICIHGVCLVETRLISGLKFYGNPVLIAITSAFGSTSETRLS